MVEEATTVVEYYGVKRKREHESVLLLDFGDRSIWVKAAEVLQWADDTITLGREYARKIGLV